MYIIDKLHVVTEKVVQLMTQYLVIDGNRPSG